MTGPHELRIGDAEREAAASALGEHYAAGRLTKEEYDERAERAFAARTNAELWPLFGDLPRIQGPARPSAGAPGSAAGTDRRGGGPRVGLLPVMLVVVGLAILVHHAGLILIALGVWFLFVRRSRGWSTTRTGRRHDHTRSW